MDDEDAHVAKSERAVQDTVVERPTLAVGEDDDETLCDAGLEVVVRREASRCELKSSCERSRSEGRRTLDPDRVAQRRDEDLAVERREHVRQHPVGQRSDPTGISGMLSRSCCASCFARWRRVGVRELSRADIEREMSRSVYTSASERPTRVFEPEITGCAAASASKSATAAIAIGTPSLVVSGGGVSVSFRETRLARSSRSAYAPSGITTASATSAPSGERKDMPTLVAAAGLRERSAARASEPLRRAASGARRQPLEQPERELEVELRVLVLRVGGERASERSRRVEQEAKSLSLVVRRREAEAHDAEKVRRLCPPARIVRLADVARERDERARYGSRRSWSA